MWKFVSKKSVLVYGISVLLALVLACGGTAADDATASPAPVDPAQGQVSQTINLSERDAMESTQPAGRIPSGSVIASATESQQTAAADDISTTVPAETTAEPMGKAPTEAAVLSTVPEQPASAAAQALPDGTATQERAPQSVPSQDTSEGSAPTAIQKPVPVPAQPVVPGVDNAPAPSAQVDPMPVAPPATPVQIESITDLDPAAIVAAQEQVFTDLYEATLPSAVHISVDRAVQGGFLPAGEGSGFVWDTNGVIVTNNHVVADSDRVWAIFEDGNVFLAEIIGTDPESDLAALRIDAPAEYLRPVSLGDSNDLKVGQLAIAIGNPFGEVFTMTSGIISALGRTITGSADSPYRIPSAIQTDAPINPGNSGGPLFDVHGNVIGINSQIISRSGSSAGVGFAIPVNIAKVVIPELITTGSHTYAYLGISGANVTSRVAEQNDLDLNVRGVLVSALTPGGPAADSGLRGAQGTARGDIITAIDGVPTRTIEDLMAYLAEHTKPGQTVVVEVIRPNDSVANIDLLLEPRPVS